MVQFRVCVRTTRNRISNFGDIYFLSLEGLSSHCHVTSIVGEETVVFPIFQRVEADDHKRFMAIRIYSSCFSQ